MSTPAEQFEESVSRTDDGGALGAIKCHRCGGSTIGTTQLTREQFSDAPGRSRTLNAWAGITEAQHNHNAHPDDE